MMIGVTLLTMWAVTSTVKRPYGTNMHMSGDIPSFEVQRLIMSKGKLVHQNQSKQQIQTWYYQFFTLEKGEIKKLWTICYSNFTYIAYCVETSLNYKNDIYNFFLIQSAQARVAQHANS